MSQRAAERIRGKEIGIFALPLFFFPGFEFLVGYGRRRGQCFQLLETQIPAFWNSDFDLSVEGTLVGLRYRFRSDGRIVGADGNREVVDLIGAARIGRARVGLVVP